jgi:hypothetical protein
LSKFAAIRLHESAFDPKRRFATANCRNAKGLFSHLVGTEVAAGKQ